jgi:hypothetical protein
LAGICGFGVDMLLLFCLALSFLFLSVLGYWFVSGVRIYYSLGLGSAWKCMRWPVTLFPQRSVQYLTFASAPRSIGIDLQPHHTTPNARQQLCIWISKFPTPIDNKSTKTITTSILASSLQSLDDAPLQLVSSANSLS